MSNCDVCLSSWWDFLCIHHHSGATYEVMQVDLPAFLITIAQKPRVRIVSEILCVILENIISASVKRAKIAWVKLQRVVSGWISEGTGLLNHSWPVWAEP